MFGQTTFKNHLLKKGEGNVQIKKKQDIQNDLCQLNKKLHQLRMKINSSLYKEFCDKNIVQDEVHLYFKSLQTSMDYVSGFQYSNTKKPLWIELSLQGSSVRSLSKEFAQHIHQKAQTIGVPTSLVLPLSKKISDKSYFHLGLYFIDPKIKEYLLFSSSLTQLEKVRIEVLTESPLFHLKNLTSQEKLLFILFLESQNLDQKSVIHKISFSFQESDFIHLNKIKRNKLFVQFSEIQKIHFFNLINFKHFKNENYELIFKNIFFIKKYLLNKITHQKLRSHIHGILNYHLARIYLKNKDPQKALEYLLISNQNDPLFFETLYLIASIYHDSGSKKALNYYQTALILSAYDSNILNDYGIFLKDINNETQFKILKKLTEIKTEHYAPY